MKEYLLNRPMLISGLLCTVISVTAYHYMPSLLIFGAVLIFAIGFEVFKGEKPEIIFSLFYGGSYDYKLRVHLRQNRKVRKIQ